MTAKALATIFLVALLGYGLLEARHIIAGPSIHIDTPSSYTTFSDGFVQG